MSETEKLSRQPLEVITHPHQSGIPIPKKQNPKKSYWRISIENLKPNHSVLIENISLNKLSAVVSDIKKQTGKKFVIRTNGSYSRVWRTE